MHYRSAKAYKWLKALPSVEFDEAKHGHFQLRHEKDKQALVDDFRKLTQDLKDEGMFDPSWLHVAYRITELFVMVLGGIFMMYYADPPTDNSFGFTPYQPYSTDTLVFWTAFIIVGIGRGRCGWFMHEGGHGSLTGSLHADWRIQEFFYNFGTGLSASYWRNQHNKHHAAPQKVDHDVDLNTLPLLAFNAKCVTDTKVGRKIMKSKFYTNWWLPAQAVLFPCVICWLVLTFWMFYLHPRFAIVKKKKMELFWLAAFWWSFFGPVWSMSALFSHWGTLQTFGIMLLAMQVSAPYIFINFAVSHTHLDVLDASKHVTWVEYSTRYTVNASNHWFVNWWMSYLNFQIEHHLWPQCPQFRFPQISPRVKALCEKHGEPYMQFGYFEALDKAFSNLAHIAEEVGINIEAVAPAVDAVVKKAQ